MKKMVSIVLALVMVMSLSLTAFASGISGDTSKDVNATYEPESTAIVYSVDISWGNMMFTYSAGSKGEWDVDNHTYKEGTAVPAGWSCDKGANEIKITNHSNTAVTAEVTFTKAEGLDVSLANVEVSFTESIGNTNANKMSIGSAEDSGAAVKETFTITVSGSVSNAFEDATLGSVSITIE